MGWESMIFATLPSGILRPAGMASEAAFLDPASR